MIKTNYQGRLGNIMLHNVGASIVAKKFNYKYDIDNCHLFSGLNPKPFNGTIEYSGDTYFTIYDHYETPLTECIYFPNNKPMLIKELLDMDNIDFGINIYSCSFQSRNFLLSYEHEVRNFFDLEYLDVDEDDVFVHLRLDDATHQSPGLEYYIACLERLNFPKGYVSSDSPNHPFVTHLIENCNLILYHDTPINTINFGKNFKNLILSGGTFSWWIGFLSKAKNVFFPKDKIKWHGDIFVFDKWQGL
jgi:hypothetical protein